MVEACSNNLNKNCPYVCNYFEQAELLKNDPVSCFQETESADYDNLDTKVSIMTKKTDKKDKKCTKTDPQAKLDQAMRIVSQYLEDAKQELKARGLDSRELANDLGKIHMGASTQDNLIGICISKCDPSAISENMIENSSPEELASYIFEKLIQMQESQNQKNSLNPTVLDENPGKKAVDEGNIFSKGRQTANPFACNLALAS